MSMSLESGFYGKLPSLGDFASRRLQQDFISSWDNWLQSSLAVSQEVLGEQWLKSYLISPIWRFALSPGLCGKDAWLGIVMPSVDRVGRYFPLTIACKVNAKTSLIHTFSEASDWFEELESVAISALENDLAVEAFDSLVRNISGCELTLKNNSHLLPADNPSVDKSTVYLDLKHSNARFDQMYSDISSQLLSTYLPGHSLWCTSGAEDISPAFLAFNGLPPASTYVEMITGQFQQSEMELSQTPITQSTEPLITQTAQSSGSSGQTSVLQTDEILENTILDNPLLITSVENEEVMNEVVEQNPNSSNSNPNSIVSTPAQRTMQNAWESFSRTDTGRVRKINEDSILDRPDLGVWLVADGMGGHEAGDVASRKIIKTINELTFSDSLDLAIPEVTVALQSVNNELRDLAARRYGQQIIGSTVVALIAGESQFGYLWAGDSRLYCLRDKKLLQLTIDHCSEQEEMTDILNLGAKTELKQNNVITRAVGAFDELELDYQVVDIQSGDIFLLSSDGLDKELSFKQIEQVLVENKCSDSANILTDQVLSLGARDNVSVIVVEIK